MDLRDLPSVDELAREVDDPLAVDAARAVIDRAREEIRAGAEPGDLRARVEAELASLRAPRLRRVLNATGVIVHTNLGRAPLAAAALDRVVEVGRGYSNLEYDLGHGRRGSRQDHVTDVLRRLTGAEAALVVNNNAGAVLLALAALAEGREVLVSRGELIEIGDGFRIPDVLARSGARLVEVGTTNRTRAVDYERAIGPETALLLRVHQSNFRVVGFTEQPRLDELAEIAKRHGLPLVDDLGSGNVLPSNNLLLGDEPSARESLDAGADLVCFSGDKLLGGPQAGIVVGRAELVERLRRHPLQRALRADKLTLAALEGTLALYLEPERARREIPVLRTLDEPAEVVQARAARLAERVGGTVEETVARVGGGALPLLELGSFACAVEEELAEPLRRGEPPVVGIVRDGRLLLDCRTLSDAEADEAAAVVETSRGRHVPRSARREHPANDRDLPRSHKDPAVITLKERMLSEPHVAPLTAFVQELRRARGEDDVPWFDPWDAGVDARILTLLETPGRKAASGLGSGFISCNNDDPTANNMWRLLRDAGIDRSRLHAAWNVVPWYIGDSERIRSVRPADLAEARSALRGLLDMFPNLRVVVLLGKAAERAWDELGATVDVAVLRAPHPSPKVLNTKPGAREAILRTLIEAKKLSESFATQA